jgi:hypothetical protein
MPFLLHYLQETPAEVKFVSSILKKWTDSFNKIERHYLAKLPDTEDAILTDNAKGQYTELPVRGNGQSLFAFERCDGAKY